MGSWGLGEKEAGSNEKRWIFGKEGKGREGEGSRGKERKGEGRRGKKREGEGRRGKEREGKNVHIFYLKDNKIVGNFKFYLTYPEKSKDV